MYVCVGGEGGQRGKADGEVPTGYKLSDCSHKCCWVMYHFSLPPRAVYHFSLSSAVFSALVSAA